MIQTWVATATAEGLSTERACAVLGLAPRTLQRWQRPAQPNLAARRARPRPVNALTRPEAATVVSVIRSPEHADESCRELAASLAHGIPAISVSPVSVWRYQVALKCNGPRGRQVHARPGRPGHGLGHRPQSTLGRRCHLADHDRGACLSLPVQSDRPLQPQGRGLVRPRRFHQ